jgi:DMSO reductase anchor subunit
LLPARWTASFASRLFLWCCYPTTLVVPVFGPCRSTLAYVAIVMSSLVIASRVVESIVFCNTQNLYKKKN